jgi:hypothetical protein
MLWLKVRLLLAADGHSTFLKAKLSGMPSLVNLKKFLQSLGELQPLAMSAASSNLGH